MSVSGALTQLLMAYIRYGAVHSCVTTHIATVIVWLLEPSIHRLHQQATSGFARFGDTAIPGSTWMINPAIGRMIAIRIQVQTGVSLEY
jgi:hypothetical protein